MKRRLAIAAVVGTVVGTVGGWLWLAPDTPSPVPEPTPVVLSRPTATPSQVQEDTGRPASPPGGGPEQRRPPPRVRPPQQGAGPARPLRPEPRPPDDAGRPPPDTGLPPPDAMLGLPDAEADDDTLINTLASKSIELPDRPLSDSELDVLHERAAWLSEACDRTGSPACDAAARHLDGAIQAAEHRRKEALHDEFGDEPPPLPPKSRPNPVGPTPPG